MPLGIRRASNRGALILDCLTLGRSSLEMVHWTVHTRLSLPLKTYGPFTFGEPLLTP